MRVATPIQARMRNPLSIAPGVLASILFLGACGGTGDDDADQAIVDAPAAQSDASLALSDIAVTVSYSGTQQGMLVVGAFRSVPPMGPPQAFGTMSAPTFPATMTLRDVQAGTVFVIGVLDMPPASPTMPGPEDLQAASGPLALDGADASVALTLVDP